MKSHATKNPENQETELKLLISPEDVARLRDHPLLKQFSVREPYAQELTSTYYDTPDFQIRQHGASLRVRQLENGFIQTLKGNNQRASALYQRGEWETHVESASPDLAALRTVAGKHSAFYKMLCDPSIEQQLQPIFETHVMRTIWELQLPEGEKIEFALDQGSIDRQDTHEPISEVELELSEGQPAKLFDFAAQLLDAVPMRIGSISKGERGYALCAGATQTPAVVKAGQIRLSKRMTVGQAFEAIIADCLSQIQGNAAGVAQDSDPENVHQMRVGLRRLHSALRLFKDIVILPDTLQQELDWLAAQLGPARDWEVLSSSTLPSIRQTAPEDIDVNVLQQAASDVAREKREQAAAAVKSVRYAKLILALSGWLQGSERREQLAHSKQMTLDAPLPRFAGIMLAHNQYTLRKRSKSLRGSDAHLRHRARIAAKKVRYATEFFESLYPGKRVSGYTKSLSALQDELGWLNDAAVADGLLHELETKREALSGGIGFARGYLMSIVKHKDRKLNKLWKRFAPLRLSVHH